MRALAVTGGFERAQSSRFGPHNGLRMVAETNGGAPRNSRAAPRRTGARASRILCAGRTRIGGRPRGGGSSDGRGSPWQRSTRPAIPAQPPVAADDTTLRNEDPGDPKRIHQDEVGQRSQPGHRAPHRLERGMMDVETVDLVRVAHADRPCETGGDDPVVEPRARAPLVSNFESRSPLSRLADPSTTAAATTGPARHPRPTSSTPATRAKPSRPSSFSTVRRAAGLFRVRLVT